MHKMSTVRRHVVRSRMRDVQQHRPNIFIYLNRLLKKSIMSLPANSHISPLIRKNIKPRKPTRLSQVFSLPFLSCSVLLGSVGFIAFLQMQGQYYIILPKALWAPSQIGKVWLMPQRHSDIFSRLGITVPSSNIISKVPVIAIGPRGFSCIVAPAAFSGSIIISSSIIVLK